MRVFIVILVRPCLLNQAMICPSFDQGMNAEFGTKLGLPDVIGDYPSPVPRVGKKPGITSRRQDLSVSTFRISLIYRALYIFLKVTWYSGLYFEVSEYLDYVALSLLSSKSSRRLPFNLFVTQSIWFFNTTIDSLLTIENFISEKDIKQFPRFPILEWC